MPKQRPTFEVGDIVRLKSGGPNMTVQKTTDYSGVTDYRCQWFAGKKLEFGQFQPESIEAVEED